MRHTDVALLDNQFLHRWSPRSFIKESLSDDVVESLFEAARWSPSCYNEQPWRFVYAHKRSDLELFSTALVESNRIWAESAPLLVFVFSKKHFTHNAKLNRWASFDAGAAWMALTLQANKLGLSTHAMGGFSIEKAFDVTKMPQQEYDVLCAVAVGKQGDVSQLPDSLQQQERPSQRKKLSELAFEREYVSD